MAAATDPESPSHVLVGDDAAMMADLYAGQSAEELHATLHAFYDLP